MNKLILVCTVAILFCTISARADIPYDVTINPVNDASVTSNGIVNSVYAIDAARQAIVKFSTSQISGSVMQASLTVNPYSMPLQCFQIGVYGYQSNNGDITSSDNNAGIFLGNWILPATLGYGEDAFFDVTQFMQTVSSPFVSFNLRSTNGGSDQFSSLEYNYGHPSQLTVTIPEPATIMLLSLGALFLRKKK